jgi:hypothetical protein
MLMLAEPASAQSAPSTPFIIHGVTVDSSEQIATEQEALLAQPVTSPRAARFDVATSAQPMGGAREKSFPAGTLMFGAYARESWSYCAMAVATFWTADQFSCFVDRNNDGLFEAISDSGTPFAGVPLFVYGAGQPYLLATPIPYSRIAPLEGPTIEYAIGYRIVRRSGRMTREGRSVPYPATHIVPIIGFRSAGGVIRPLSGPESQQRIPLEDGQKATVRIAGAVIEVLEVGHDDSITYRVVQTIPAQIKQIILETVP